MLSMNELKIGVNVTINGAPYTILKSDHHKMGRGGAVLKLKLRNLLNGAVLERTVQGNESMEEADLEKKTVQFLYEQDGVFSFMDQESYETITLDEKAIGDKKNYLKEGLETDALYYNGSAVSIELPIKMKFRVVESPPGIKGDTAQGGSKQIKIETGLTVTAPLFIKEGEEIVIDTRDGSYVERG